MIWRIWIAYLIALLVGSGLIFLFVKGAAAWILFVVWVFVVVLLKQYFLDRARK